MKPTIEIKRIVLYVAVLLIAVVSKVAAVNPPDSIPFSDSWVQTNWTETNSFFNLSSSQKQGLRTHLGQFRRWSNVPGCQ